MALSPQRALIFRITHIDHLPWLLANGIHCATGSQDPGFVAIGDPDLTDRRFTRTVPRPPGGTLADYVAFYFTPKAPMLFNIRTGHRNLWRRENDEIVVLVSAIPRLVALGLEFLFTDRHAYTRLATFCADPTALETMLDWDILGRHDFRRSDGYPDKMERYQAEALVHRHVPVAALLGIACASEPTRNKLESLASASSFASRIVSRPEWYFW